MVDDEVLPKGAFFYGPCPFFANLCALRAFALNTVSEVPGYLTQRREERKDSQRRELEEGSILRPKGAPPIVGLPLSPLRPISPNSPTRLVQ